MEACLISEERGDGHYGGESRISGKGRCVLWGRVSHLPNSTNKTINRIFYTGYSLCQHAHACLHTSPTCAQMGTRGPAHEAPRRA
jgi:hypothetical protein